MSKIKIAVVGLGYVGLPLAIALARIFEVVGFDINAQRIAQLNRCEDITREIDKKDLQETTLCFTTELEKLRHRDVYIITVPTPVTDNHDPDLSSLKSACESVGHVLSKGSIVVFESTVYPGVTEDICGPILEKISGLTMGTDFFLGYSPERINPGDKSHTIDHITKIVSAQTPEALNLLKDIYGALNQGNIFCATSIRTAEAAKVIENAQRDINVAFINEITRIMHAMGLCTHDVLEAARTKWNFLPFYPGLVGGHCIGVDPYYLAYCAKLYGLSTDIILAGRATNENMGAFIVSSLRKKLLEDNIETGRLLILGVTFKENVPDTRNTKVLNVIEGLEKDGYQVDVYDPYVTQEEAKELGISLVPQLPSKILYEGVVCLVPHTQFYDLPSLFVKILKPKALIADIRGIWKGVTLAEGLRYWSL